MDSTSEEGSTSLIPPSETFKRNDLATLLRRDEASLEYEKIRLIDGDTLVIAKLPNGSSMYHPQGFKLDSTFRIASEKLLATGSSFFNLMLSESKQAKQRQLPAFAGKELPAGIKYVLDLSPSGDDGEELLQLLSCPEGLRQWASVGALNNVKKIYIGGEDEYEYNGIGGVLISQNCNESMPGITVATTTSPEAPKSDESPPATAQPKSPKQGDNGKNPVQKHDGSAAKASAASDYTIARHCAGIERLLQLIAGKIPRLDSAPKVWMLAGLAAKYDCTNVVVDHVLTWILLPSNPSLIEIHPEAAFTLGLNLKSPLLTRAAFSILVAEEAMSIRPTTAPSQRELQTPLGRIRDVSILDEDQLNVIQKAALVFNDQIAKSIEHLTDPNMLWLSKCAEHKKLQSFRQRLHNDVAFRLSKQYSQFLSIIDGLEETLGMYYRGRVLASETKGAPSTKGPDETYRAEANWHLQSSKKFEDAYRDLDRQQKWCTRQLWEQFRSFCYLATSDPSITRYELKQLQNANGIRQIQAEDVYEAVNQFNLAVLWFESRHVDLAPLKSVIDDDEFFVIIQSTKSILDRRYVRLCSDFYLTASFGGQPTPLQCLAHELETLNNSHISPISSSFLNIKVLASQARSHILGICTSMLARPIESETLGLGIAEGITCLGEEQWKFLPLWAGGCDDGSGGVGTDFPAPSNITWGEIGINPSVAGPSTLGESRAGNGGETASLYSGISGPQGSISHLGFDQYRFQNLPLRPRTDFPDEQGKGKGKATSPSIAYSADDDFSDLGYAPPMSEISFSSTLNTNSNFGVTTPSSASISGERDAAGIANGQLHTDAGMSQGLREVMSDDFMLEENEDDIYFDDDDDDNEEEDFGVISGDEGEETEKED